MLPFGFLHEAEEENLAQLLAGERPQTIALVLSHLPAERAGDVLARFAPVQQVEVVRRLVDLENSDPEALHDVERALESRLSQQFASRQRRGPARRPSPEFWRPAITASREAFSTTWPRMTGRWPSNSAAGN